jgi:hypothetical protein
MGKSRDRIRLVAAAALAAFACALPASARNVEVREPIFNKAAAAAFPQAIFDEIVARITYQTTFQQIGPKGLVRWWTRTVELADFVESRSHTDPDTYLYAMRYLVSVLSDRDTLSLFRTSCQVVVVLKNGEYDDPTVVCEPVNLDQPGDLS